MDLRTWFKNWGSLASAVVLLLVALGVVVLLVDWVR